MSSKFDMMGNGEVHIDQKSLTIAGISSLAFVAKGFKIEAFDEHGKRLTFDDMKFLERPKVYVMYLKPGNSPIDWGKNPLHEAKDYAVIAELPDGTRLPIVKGSGELPISKAITIRSFLD